MAKVEIKVQPSGLLNGQVWPAAGETVEVPDVVAESMAAAGHVKVLDDEPKVEKRPASRKGVETRKG